MKRVKSWLKTQHSKNEDHSIWFQPFMANRWVNNGKSERLYFLGLKITVDGDRSHEIKILAPWKKSYDKPRQLTKVCIIKAMVFPAVMHGCQSWTIKKLSKELMFLNCVVLKETLESPLDSKEIKSVNPKENQP